ncbi:MAG: M28 family metallopeptidase [Bryobacterales bacterium]|nr:M28 family metallopeptidase [Bryobacterales bacterium]
MISFSAQCVRRCLAALAAAACIVALAAQERPAPPSAGMLGFPDSQVAAQRTLEQSARARASATEVGKYMHVMAAHPHHAGTEASRKVAEYILTSLRGWGLEAEYAVYEVMLPFPGERRLELLQPSRYKALLKEPAIDQDPSSGQPGQLPTFNAYAGNGDVTAGLVYVNYGTPEDYAELEKRGVSVKGKIVIARYGRSWRGIKPKLAQERGAVGCIIYSDPADDGFGKGAVYPEGPHRPPQGVQRGSVMDMPIYPGDPTTPFTPSLPGAQRLSVEESPTILKIPVLPISHSDAQPLLEAIGGEPAPAGWKGGLPLEYRLGDGNSKARLEVRNRFELRKIYNVIATIPGKDFPDEWVMYGNHHDAWVNGANDPVSGASVVLETARVLASLKQEGWQPSRTIKLAFWDGEEFGIIGSTEWVEQHARELQRKLVAYFNSDSNGRGQLRVGGSHHLAPYLRELLAEVEDPASGRSVLEARVRIQNSMDGQDRPFPVDAAGSGSDYAPFLHHITMPSLNFGFGGGCPSAGVYHSIYDSIAWYEKYCDPGHRYGKALSDVMLTALLRLSNAPVLPYDFAEVARIVAGYAREVELIAREKGQVLDIASLLASLQSLLEEGLGWNRWVAANRDRLAQDKAAASAVNQALLAAEQRLALTRGLPGRPWYRHQVYAPGLFTGYGVKTLPGIRESLEQNQPEVAQQHVAELNAALARLRAHLRQTRQLGQARPRSPRAANAAP